MAALIRQANSGYELANEPKIKTKDVWWKRREKTRQQQQTLSGRKKKRRQELSASNVTKAGYTETTKTHQLQICKRLTLKKYATTRSIAHITIYNKHKT